MKINNSRPEEFNTLSKWLRQPLGQNGQIEIFGISGYGGIGKSYLLNQVLIQEKPEKLGFLPIYINANNLQEEKKFIKIYDQGFSPKTIPFGKAEYDYFPHVRNVVNKSILLAEEAKKIIDASKESETIKEIIKLIIDTGRVFNGIFKSDTKITESSKNQISILDRIIENDQAFDLACNMLSSLYDNRDFWLPGPVQDILGITFDKHLRTDLYGLCAREWVTDLSAILNCYQYNDFYRLTHSPIEGLKYLLLIIDDFEFIKDLTIEFLSKSLIPVLEKSNFYSKIVIIGRDDLYNTHVSFQHHLSHLIQDEIRLEPLSEEIARNMFLEAGYTNENAESLIKDCYGFPFLISLLCEGNKGGVSFYQQFYERTTKWMTPEQKEWLIPLCYLDQINESTIEEMIPNHPAKKIMEWFEHEASLRDPHANCYVISSYIRTTLKEYHRKKLGDKKWIQLVNKGREASASKM